MKDLRPIHQNGLLTVVRPTHTIISFIKWAVEQRMRFILVLSGQTGHRLFFRLLLYVDIGGDKSSRINTSFSSYWFARTTSPSSHPEVLPPGWPLSVTCGPRSFIYLHIAPIYFTKWRQQHCTVGAWRSHDVMLRKKGFYGTTHSTMIVNYNEVTVCRK